MMSALKMTFAWNIEGLVTTLLVMLKGMVGIFAVILVIWLVIAILNKATVKRPKDGEQQ